MDADVKGGLMPAFETPGSMCGSSMPMSWIQSLHGGWPREWNIRGKWLHIKEELWAKPKFYVCEKHWGPENKHPDTGHFHIIAISGAPISTLPCTGSLSCTCVRYVSEGPPSSQVTHCMGQCDFKGPRHLSWSTHLDHPSPAKFADFPEGGYLLMETFDQCSISLGMFKSKP